MEDKQITEESKSSSSKLEEEKKAKQIKRKLWSQEEDEAIKKIAESQGENLNWTMVAKSLEKEYGIKGRTGK